MLDIKRIPISALIGIFVTLLFVLAAIFTPWIAPYSNTEIVGEINDTRRELFYLSNRAAGVREITPGVYGLSNHLLDTPWPKVSKGKKQLRSALTTAFDKEVYFDLHADESLADDNYLPDTGIGFEKEKALSAIFIKTPNYGTRCSNLVTISKSFVPSLEERVFV